MSTNIDQYTEACGRLAVELGMKHVVIIVEDGDGELKFLASADGKAHLRKYAAEKFGLIDADELASSTGFE